MTAIVNSSGVSVAEYTYNAWGKLLTATGTMSATLGALNPLRYRGYVYDAETGFYYLQSRYYDPGICRFINADAYASTGQRFVGYNMFAYCGNNPVNMFDSHGRIPSYSSLVTDSGQMDPQLRALLRQKEAAECSSRLVFDVTRTTTIGRLVLKGGVSIVTDMLGTSEIYFHLGIGVGYSNGWSVSLGAVENYHEIGDYSRDFVDMSGGFIIGIDHCYSPHGNYEDAVKATSIVISIGTGGYVSFGVDYYLKPIVYHLYK